MARSSPTPRITLLTGTPGDDVLRGSRRRDVITGLEGNDQLFGRGDRDRLRGDAGNDLLEGGGGSDRLIPGPGNDLIRPGRGRNDRVGPLADGRFDLVRFQAGRNDPLRFGRPDPLDRIVLGGVATAEIRIDAIRGDRVGLFTGNRLEAFTRGISVADLRDLVIGSLG
ncbi:MAG: calcium-binding protein [Cyanobacteriota bacterium]|nr:calcium-binding protein [Cyanobacteriota bacterium]